uniref:Uncharacterized protein n=1 Tax=Brassica oleracea TaxID=3712 RepID=A0A3P6EGR9_BRAOL|nr:unnamed protein product [Brassica oleracea]
MRLWRLLKPPMHMISSRQWRKDMKRSVEKEECNYQVVKNRG